MVHPSRFTHNEKKNINGLTIGDGPTTTSSMASKLITVALNFATAAQSPTRGWSQSPALKLSPHSSENIFSGLAHH